MPLACLLSRPGVWGVRLGTLCGGAFARAVRERGDGMLTDRSVQIRFDPAQVGPVVSQKNLHDLRHRRVGSAFSEISRKV